MLVINKQNNPKIIVIWLHGLTPKNHIPDFKNFIEILGFNDIEFILPNAPLIPITVNQGLVMHGWYDIKSFKFEEHDIKGLHHSVNSIEKVIQDRLKKSNKNIKICLAGFSQGAAVSLFFALNSLVKIDAVISLSGYLPGSAKKILVPKIPMLALHGAHDDIINIDYAKKSFGKLINQDNFKLLTFNMGHEIILEQVTHIKQFLMRV